MRATTAEPNGLTTGMEELRFRVAEVENLDSNVGGKCCYHLVFSWAEDR